MSVTRGATTSRASTAMSSHAPNVAPGIIRISGSRPSQASERAQPRKHARTSASSAHASSSLSTLCSRCKLGPGGADMS
eukprot:scaffold3690_cov113-Isochrysis_galbana.AAC.12